MRKLIIGIIIFFISVVAVDLVFGAVCKYLISHAKSGFTWSHEYVANHCEDDILIFGSSRALHHYVPEIISDSLGMSCYNCGVDGNGILYLYSRYIMVTNRYTPKVIIYDVSIAFDVESDDYSKYLGWQRRYCSLPGIMDVIEDINPVERWKLMNNLYRYNGCFLQLLADNFHPAHVLDKTGYEPSYKVMDYEPTNNNQAQSLIRWDEKKKSYFDKLVSDCRERGIILIFAYSPIYGKISSDIYKEVTDYCSRNNIPLLDYYAKEGISNKREYFSDSNHLNDTGARVFTKAILPHLHSIIH